VINAAGKKNRLKMKNINQLCPLRRATRAGQNARHPDDESHDPDAGQPHPDIASSISDPLVRRR
jgi:hypothetical protein